MSSTVFDRDAAANFYAEEHLKVDPGVLSIHYLPNDAPDREIRFVEVNKEIAEMKDDSLEPTDFGVDRGTDLEHTLYVLDVTPGQWSKISQDQPALSLPAKWSLRGRKTFERSGLVP